MTFRITLSLSTAIHLLFISLLWLFSTTGKPKSYYAPVYSVNLVELPAGANFFIPTSPTKETPLPAKAVQKVVIPKIVKSEKIPVIIAKIPEPKITSASELAKAPSIPAIKPTVASASVGPVITIGPAGTGLATEGIPFPYPYYLLAVQNKVSDNWQPPGKIGIARETKTILFFQIQRNGHISNAQIEQSSGSPQLDAAALRAVRLADPLPPLPQGFKQDILRVHFGFVYYE